jgi:hypothetical protein
VASVYLEEEKQIDLIIKINVQINYQVDIIKSINLHITNKNTILDILKISIDIFNELFYKENIPYKFNIDYRKYSLKPSKKSGRADEDLPSIYIEIFI